jgi:hypothetical protein
MRENFQSNTTVEDLPEVLQKTEAPKKTIDPEVIEKLPEEDLALLREELGLHPLLDVHATPISEITPAAERQQPTPWEGDGSAERYTQEVKSTPTKTNRFWLAIKKIFE